MTVVLAGCGDLGTEAALRFAALGHHVLGLRRSAGKLPSSIEGVSIDLSTIRPTLPADTEVVVVALSAGSRDVDTYRASYVDGLRSVLDALDEAGAVEARVLFVSSTAVYDVDDGSVVDETTPATGASPTAEVILEAEALLHRRRPGGIVLRLGGIYGPGRERLITQVRDGEARLAEPAGSSPHTNRIHRDDAAAAIVHLTTSSGPTAALYVGVDDEPSRLDDVLAFVADELGLPVPPSAPPRGRQAGGDKRLSNARLRGTGFDFAYPTYREGYRAVIAGEGVRHP
ncbi:NAD-dependent epimerase/dehydratase family protein [Frigoribacterium sp. VKM Ac-2836]|uniref:NAD-dependent epimerase/dehydratase family protein n=1 Tax=Frigoribacterium sp. VKM Ac-2836 TaxID=2739014 RepID=UPI001566BC6F|nr:NAD-dependent epimerase/dehydratase family protein [Frigoribacterium sp. VKM Ac-2836]NRD26594.1 NAD-dependent epimerase/dehydratase family protein [Frigoribacterium sp. VKM Ac-2836]